MVNEGERHHNDNTLHRA